MAKKWYLAPSLARLFAEVNKRWPNRSKASDGSVGDLAHQARTSEHNPDSWGCVRAIDITAKGIDPLAVVRAAIKHPACYYVIYNRTIRSRTYGFRPQRYTGSNPHTKHVHVSIMSNAFGHATPAQRKAAENSTVSWGIASPAPKPAPKPKPWDGKSFPGAAAFKVGTKGAWVTYLGKRLVAWGFKGYGSDQPGPLMTSTDAAGILWFQKLQGWKGDAATGKMGPTTWARLGATPPKKPTPTPTPTPKPTPAPTPKPKPLRITGASLKEAVTLSMAKWKRFTLVQGLKWSGREYFAVQAYRVSPTREDTVVHRYSAKGVYLDSMTLVNAGHGSTVSVVVSKAGVTEVWLGWRGPVCKIAYRPGSFKITDAARVPGVINGNPALSLTGRWLTVRRGLSGERDQFVTYDLSSGAPKQAGSFIATRPKGSPFQGHLAYKGEVFVAYGASGKASVVRQYSRKGGLLGSLDTTSWQRTGEAEGLMAKGDSVYVVKRVGVKRDGKRTVRAARIIPA